MDESAATSHRDRSPAPGQGAGVDGPSVRMVRSRSPILGALDGGGTFLQRHGREVLVGSAMLLLPVVVLNLWITTVVFERDGVSSISVLGGDDVNTGIEDVAALLIVLSGSFAAALIGRYVGTLYVGHTFGPVVGIRSAMAHVARGLPSVVAVWSLGHIWLPFVTVWGLSGRSDEVSGRLVVVAPAAVLFSSLTLTAVPVLVAEDRGVLGTLKRAVDLARTRFGSSCGFVVASTIVGGALLGGLAWLPVLAEETGFITFGGYIDVVQGITTQLGVIIVVPLVGLATMRFYVEVRLDAEGMDLVLHADEAFNRLRDGDGGGR